MKMTKKILSVLLAVIMMFSFAAVAFAADGETGEIGKTYTLELKKGESKTFTFTADKTGEYFVTAVVIEGEESGEIDIDSPEYVYGGYFDIEGIFDMHHITLNENDEMSIVISNTNDDSDTVKYELNVSYVNDSVLSLGENTIEKALCCFIFTPEKDGLYNFRSSNIGDLDPVITLYEDYDELGRNEFNGYSGDCNFDLTAPLEAGKTYIVKFLCYGTNKVEQPFTVTVACDKDINLEDIEYPHADEKEAIVYKNTMCWYGLNLIPTGAAYSDEITVTVGNERILKARMVDGETLELSPLRLGKTTVTLSAESGLQKTFTVRVLPRFFYTLQRLFLKIELLFARIF